MSYVKPDEVLESMIEAGAAKAGTPAGRMMAVLLGNIAGGLLFSGVMLYLSHAPKGASLFARRGSGVRHIPAGAAIAEKSR